MAANFLSIELRAIAATTLIASTPITLLPANRKKTSKILLSAVTEATPQSSYGHDELTAGTVTSIPQKTQVFATIDDA
jgi:hypothetical protein